MVPTVVTCPNEMVALSCAHGFAQVSGRAQAVIVHVDCGTQALAGALHNAMRGRVPVFIFAGLSPATQEGEAVGSRNEFIHWLQDVPDQRGIVRQYVKYENEIRSPANIKQIVQRALQIAESEPKGPVYLVAAREALEGEAPAAPLDGARWQPTGAAALPPGAAEMLVDKLARAHRPLVVTSYLGRQPAAVDELVTLCTRLGVGVLESVPSTMNYPPADPLHQGSQWNQPVQNAALAEADVVLVLDSDVPWVPTVNRPAAERRDLPHRYRPAEAVDAALVHRRPCQLRRRCADRAPPDERLSRWRSARPGSGGGPPPPLRPPPRGAGRGAARPGARRPTGRSRRNSSPPRSRNAIGDDAIVLNEGITNYDIIFDQMARSRPGTIFASGGSSLGWHGGAAIGAKLAAPERTVVALDRRRLLPVFGSLDGALDGAALPHAVPDRRLQQRRLAGAEVLGARRPSGRLCRQGRRHRRRFRAGARPWRHRRRGRRRLARRCSARRSWTRPSPRHSNAVSVEKRAAVLDVMLPHL